MKISIGELLAQRDLMAGRAVAHAAEVETLREENATLRTTIIDLQQKLEGKDEELNK